MSATIDCKPFRIHCEAAGSGALDVCAERTSTSFGQQVLRNGHAQLWDFVLVLAQQGSDGTLKTRVLLCHPDWDDPLEIASIESSPENLNVRVGTEEPVRSNREPVTKCS